MSSDEFPRGHGSSLTGPATHCEIVTIASADIPLGRMTRAFRNISDSPIDLKVKMRSGSDHTFKNVLGGQVIVARFDLIYHTGSTDGELELHF